MTARQIIQKAYNNQVNIMTPKVLKCGVINDVLVFELSEGKGFTNEKIYGVTIVKYENGKVERHSELSKLCHSYGEALNYINSIE